MNNPKYLRAARLVMGFLWSISIGGLITVLVIGFFVQAKMVFDAIIWFVLLVIVVGIGHVVLWFATRLSKTVRYAFGVWR